MGVLRMKIPILTKLLDMLAPGLRQGRFWKRLRRLDARYANRHWSRSFVGICKLSFNRKSSGWLSCWELF
jgi:hypothetical protein